MTITYKINNDMLTGNPIAVTKYNDNVFVHTIPFDPANTDYQAYLKWLEEGNTPLPAEQTA